MPIVYSRKRHRPSPNPPISPPPTKPALPSPRSPPSPPSPPLPKRPRRKFVQLHIDAGQSDISVRTCPTCHMVYTPGAKQDTKLHRVHHSAYLRQKTQTPRLLCSLRELLDENENGNFYMVKNSDGCREIRFAKKVDSWIGRFLGESVGGFEGEWGCVLYGEGRFVKGFVYGERVGRVCEEEGGQWKTGTFCGVGRVWVAEGWRRKGIAGNMIDLLRRELVYGYVYKGEDVAFGGGVTSGGRLFAGGYMSKYGGQVLMYGSGKVADGEKGKVENKR